MFVLCFFLVVGVFFLHLFFFLLQPRCLKYFYPNDVLLDQRRGILRAAAAATEVREERSPFH